MVRLRIQVLGEYRIEIDFATTLPPERAKILEDQGFVAQTAPQDQPTVWALEPKPTTRWEFLAFVACSCGPTPEQIYAAFWKDFETAPDNARKQISNLNKQLRSWMELAELGEVPGLISTRGNRVHFRDERVTSDIGDVHGLLKSLLKDSQRATAAEKLRTAEALLDGRKLLTAHLPHDPLPRPTGESSEKPPFWWLKPEQERLDEALRTARAHVESLPVIEEPPIEVPAVEVPAVEVPIRAEAPAAAAPAVPVPLENPEVDRLAELARAYVAGLVDTLKYLEDPVEVDHRPIRVPLEEVYLALRSLPGSPAELRQSGILQEGRGRGSYEPPSSRRDREREQRAGAAEVLPVNLGEAFRHHPTLLVLGDPGSGKSTLTHWLALRIGSVFLETGPGPIVWVPAEQVDPDAPEGEKFNLGPARLPILVRAAEFVTALRNGSLTLADFLGHGKVRNQPVAYPAGHPQVGRLIPPDELNRLFHHALTQGQAVVLFDGLDEALTVADRIEVVQALHAFLDAFFPPEVCNRNQLVVTSRIVGYEDHRSAMLRGSVVPFQIEPLEPSAIRQYCRGWYRAVLSHARGRPAARPEVEARVTRLMDQIQDPRRPGLLAMAGNPFLLGRLCGIALNDGERLPELRAELYERIVRDNVVRWIERTRAPERMEPDLLDLLSRLATHIHQTRSTGLIDRESLVAFVQAEAAALPGLAGIPEIAAVVRTGLGLLDEKGEGRLAFRHLSIQEYLAGRALFSRGLPEGPQLRRLMSDARWRVALQLGLGHASLHRPDFNALLAELVKLDDAPDTEIPGGSLLLFSALADIRPPAAAVVETALQHLFLAYSRQGDSQSDAWLTDYVEDCFLRIHQGAGEWAEAAGAVDRVLLAALQSPDDPEQHEMSEAAARLLFRCRCWSQLTLSGLVVALDAEGERERSWIRRALAAAVSQIPSPGFRTVEASTLPDNPAILSRVRIRQRHGQVPLPSLRLPAMQDVLPFRYELEQHPRYRRQILADPDWTRLVVTLYGGHAFYDLAGLDREITAAREEVENGSTEARRRDAARRLDVELVPLRSWLVRRHVEFYPALIYEDSPLTPRLLGALQAGRSATSLLDELRSLAASGGPEGSVRLQADALAAWMTLEADPAGWALAVRNAPAPVLPRALGKIRRASERLQDLVLREADATFASLDSSRRHYPSLSFRELFVAGVRQLRQAGGTRCHLHLLGHCTPDEAGPVITESWHHRYHSEDVRYDMAVALDTHSATLLRDRNAFEESIAELGDDASGLHLLAHSPRWPPDRLRLLLCLQAVAGLLAELDFLGGWILGRLAVPLAERSPDLLPLAMLLANRITFKSYRGEGLDVLRQEFTALHPEDVLSRLAAEVGAVTDPFVQLLTRSAFRQAGGVLPLAQPGFDELRKLKDPVEQFVGGLLLLEEERRGEVRARLEQQAAMDVLDIPAGAARVEARLVLAAVLEGHAAEEQLEAAWRELSGEPVFPKLLRIPGIPLLRWVAEVVRLGLPARSNSIPLEERVRLMAILFPMLPAQGPLVEAFGRYFQELPPAEQAAVVSPDGAILRRIAGVVWQNPGPGGEPEVRRWTHLALRAHLLGVLRLFAPALSADAWWKRAAEDPEALAALVRQGRSPAGLQLSFPALEALERLADAGRDSDLKRLLPLLQGAASEHLPRLEEWVRGGRHPELRRYGALYLLERDRWMVGMPAALTELMREPGRGRFRVEEALYGRRSQDRGECRLSHLSREVLEEIAACFVRLLDEASPLRHPWHWFNVHIRHDQKGLLSDWARSLVFGSAPHAELEFLISRIAKVTPDVGQEMAGLLTTATGDLRTFLQYSLVQLAGQDKENAQMIWARVRPLLYRDGADPEFALAALAAIRDLGSLHADREELHRLAEECPPVAATVVRTLSRLNVEDEQAISGLRHDLCCFLTAPQSEIRTAAAEGLLRLAHWPSARINEAALLQMLREQLQSPVELMEALVGYVDCLWYGLNWTGACRRAAYLIDRACNLPDTDEARSEVLAFTLFDRLRTVLERDELWDARAGDPTWLPWNVLGVAAATAERMPDTYLRWLRTGTNHQVTPLLCRCCTRPRSWPGTEAAFVLLSQTQQLDQELIPAVQAMLGHVSFVTHSAILRMDRFIRIAPGQTERILELLQDESPLVRYHAARLLVAVAANTDLEVNERAAFLEAVMPALSRAIAAASPDLWVDLLECRAGHYDRVRLRTEGRLRDLLRQALLELAVVRPADRRPPWARLLGSAQLTLRREAEPSPTAAPPSEPPAAPREELRQWVEISHLPTPNPMQYQQKAAGDPPELKELATALTALSQAAQEQGYSLLDCLDPLPPA